MSDALEEHDGKVSIGGRNITNLRFADDIDALAEEEQELEALVESLDKTCTRYKMEISAEISVEKSIFNIIESLIIISSFFAFCIYHICPIFLDLALWL